VATVTQGPGLANATGTLYSAVRERAPIVVIVADTATVRRGHAQNGDQAAMVRPTGAIFDQVLSAQTAPDDLAYGAERDNLQGRGHGVGLSLIPWPDLAPVADALGGSGFNVRTAADLQHMAKVIAERHAPLLIDVKLDPAATVA